MRFYGQGRTVNKVLLILCYFLRSLISVPVDVLAAGSLLQLCWSYQAETVVTLTNLFPPLDVSLFSDVFIFGKFCVFRLLL